MAFLASLLLLRLATLCELSLWAQGAFVEQGSTGHVGKNSVLSSLDPLSSLLSTDFAVLTHPMFPQHSVRVKKSNFCDNTVGVYTGYIDFGTRHTFFTFFESRSNPAKDDVILWIPGGPGCSSATGILMSLGPCRLSSTNHNETVLNPHSWNNRANLIFVDTPLNVGYSYADYGETGTTTDEVAEDISTFVRIFFEHFTAFQDNKFHTAGGSYGGRFVPVFASYIYDHNVELAEKGLKSINLVSVVIANGYTHFAHTYGSLYDMACTPASVPPVLGVSTCVKMKQAQSRCSGWLQRSCVNIFDAPACRAAAAFCENELQVPVIKSGINPYDLSRKCDGVYEENLCYPAFADVPKYMDRPETRNLLGVDPSLNKPYRTCSSKVNWDFSYGSLDYLHTSDVHVAALLERGIKVLTFVGKNDFVCSHVGNLKWVLGLDWTGRKGFAAAETQDWSLPRSAMKAGTVRSSRGLTYLIMDDAGHISPYDKPEEASFVINGWIDGLWS